MSVLVTAATTARRSRSERLASSALLIAGGCEMSPGCLSFVSFGSLSPGGSVPRQGIPPPPATDCRVRSHSARLAVEHEVTAGMDRMAAQPLAHLLGTG